MDSRAKKLIALAQKRTPLSLLSPNLLPKPQFDLKMKKCERFIRNHRTQQEMRDMSDKSLDDIEKQYQYIPSL